MGTGLPNSVVSGVITLRNHAGDIQAVNGYRNVIAESAVERKFDHRKQVAEAELYFVQRGVYQIGRVDRISRIINQIVLIRRIRYIVGELQSSGWKIGLDRSAYSTGSIGRKLIGLSCDPVTCCRIAPVVCIGRSRYGYAIEYMSHVVVSAVDNELIDIGLFDQVNGFRFDRIADIGIREADSHALWLIDRFSFATTCPNRCGCDKYK